MEQVKVFADDLSGAAECATALHVHGFAPRLLLCQDAYSHRHSGCTVFDLDARDRLLSRAEVSSIRLAAGDIAFCKIDSLLRGNWCELIRALLRGEATAVLCPALPRLGRHVIDGQLLLSSDELERLQEPEPVSSNIMVRLAAAGLPGSMALRACEMTPTTLGEALGHCRVVVADARCDDDLQQIVQVCMACKPRPFLVGSAGLMEALCSFLSKGASLASVTSDLASLARPMLFLIGSAHPVSQRQLLRLAERDDVVLHTDNLRGRPPRPVAFGSMAALCIKADTLAADGRFVVSRFVKRSLPLVRRAGTLFVSGGETGRVLCELLSVQELLVAGSIEPGVNVVTMPG
jgi:uncharacterized protein YgbK (DUF1537 family)